MRVQKVFVPVVFLFSGALQAAPLYNASDVLKYALTAHGISYLLRDKPGSVNAWKVGEVDLFKIETLDGSVVASRWGNTDCSGLTSAAYRYRSFKRPNESGKAALSTGMFAEAAKAQTNGFYFVEGSLPKLAKHGDMINRTGAPYGHVFLFNGMNERNLVETVEAKCTKCGVGRFVRSWNDVLASSYKIIRNTSINQDITDTKKNFTLSDASDARSTYSSLGPVPRPEPEERRRPRWWPFGKKDKIGYEVNSGDGIEEIAMALEISSSKLLELNKEINWKRLKVGDQLDLVIE